MVQKKPSRPSGVPKTLKSYIVCASPRSGSNLLCEALWHTGVAGRPLEHFLYWHQAVHEPAWPQTPNQKLWFSPPDPHMRKLLAEGTTANGVFGTKLMGTHLGFVIARLRAFPQYASLRTPELFPAILPDLHYIYITRDDKVRQAVSLAKAIQSGKWIKKGTQAGDTPEKPLVYDFAELAGCYRRIQEQERGWETYFQEADIAPYRVIYESFEKTYEPTLLDVLAYLRVSRPSPSALRPPKLKRQSDAINDEWAEQFAAELGT